MPLWKCGRTVLVELATEMMRRTMSKERKPHFLFHFEYKYSKLLLSYFRMRSLIGPCFSAAAALVFLFFHYGTIQALRHQRGGWVGSENGNF